MDIRGDFVPSAVNALGTFPKPSPFMGQPGTSPRYFRSVSKATDSLSHDAGRGALMDHLFSLLISPCFRTSSARSFLEPAWVEWGSQVPGSLHVH